jgi:Ca2+-transporting ATPase
MNDALSPNITMQGLSEVEAQRRLKAGGYNELPQPDRRTPLRIVLEVLREPMLALLLGGGVLYLLLGDLEEAIILLVFAMLSIVITVVQEARTERVLQALRDLTSPRALVIRDGERKRIAGREVVRDDLVVLSEGDGVPADAALVQSHDLQTDESLLTGESVPVRKVAMGNAASSLSARPGGDDLPFVFSGSLVVRGAALAKVTATGAATEMGNIGQTLRALEIEPPRLQAQTRRLVWGFALIGATVSGLAVVFYGLLRGGWLDAVLAGISLGMAMLPEEFPVVLTVFMAMGAWRISQARVLTRRAAAIESLGSATVLCSDKTGPLTENRMSVAEMRLKNGETIQYAKSDILSKGFQELIEFGMLASAPVPIDPMEKAFEASSREQSASAEKALRPGWALVKSYGLRRDLLAMSQVWQRPGDELFVVAAKGAPEAIAALCHFDTAGRDALRQSVDAMAAAGLRVLGVARAVFAETTWPESQHDFTFEFLGLVGLADPVRANVPPAVRECQSAGVRVVMITGDYPATAQSIARQAGIHTEDAVTREELEHLTDAELALRVRTATVFARVMPEQKLRIVEALKANGEIVAMTGDGVNDAPSLKAAHIGIAMGGRGTDVAREASSIVLLDDDFGRSSRRSASGGVFTTTCARPWALSSPSMFRSQVLRFCPWRSGCRSLWDQFI